MLGAASDEQIEAKNDMKTLQVLVVHGRRFCAVLEAPAVASETDVYTCCADGAGEAAAGHNSLHG